MAPEERNWREIPFAPDVLDMWDIGGDPDEPEDPKRARLRAERALRANLQGLGTEAALV